MFTLPPEDDDNDAGFGPQGDGRFPDDRGTDSDDLKRFINEFIDSRLDELPGKPSAEISDFPVFDRSRETILEAALSAAERLRTFAESNPSAKSVQAHINDIFEMLQQASGIPELLEPAIDILERLITPLEQSSQWEHLHERMTLLLPLLRGRHAKLLPRWYALWIEHLNYAGMRKHFSMVETEMRQAFAAADLPINETNMKFMRLLKPENTLSEQWVLSAELIQTARRTADKELLLRVTLTTAYLYGERYLFEPLLEQAWMAWRLAIEVGDVRREISSLNYVATACYQLDMPEMALYYLDLAEPLAEQMDDNFRLAHLKTVRGLCLYMLQQYVPAAVLLTETAQHFPERGIFFGRTIYLLAMVQRAMLLHKEAEALLRYARDLFDQLGELGDILNAEIALAQCSFEVGNSVVTIGRLVEHILPFCRRFPHVVSDMHRRSIQRLIEAYAHSGHFDGIRW